MTKPKATLTTAYQRARAGQICQITGFAQSAARAKKSLSWLKFDFSVLSQTQPSLVLGFVFDSYPGRFDGQNALKHAIFLQFVDISASSKNAIMAAAYPRRPQAPSSV